MISFLLLSLLVIFSIALFISVKKNLELFDRLQRTDDALQDCIRVLEEQVEKMDAKTKLEIFSDEPIIRELVSDMSTAKEAVIIVSNMLDDLIEEQDDAEI